MLDPPTQNYRPFSVVAYHFVLHWGNVKVDTICQGHVCCHLGILDFTKMTTMEDVCKFTQFACYKKKHTTVQPHAFSLWLLLLQQEEISVSLHNFPVSLTI